MRSIQKADWKNTSAGGGECAHQNQAGIVYYVSSSEKERIEALVAQIYYIYCMYTPVGRKWRLLYILMLCILGAIYLYSLHAESVFGALQLHNLTARIINYQTMIYGSDANCKLPHARPTYPPERVCVQLSLSPSAGECIHATCPLSPHTASLINDIIYLQRCNKIIRLAGLPQSLDFISQPNTTDTKPAKP